MMRSSVEMWKCEVRGSWVWMLDRRWSERFGWSHTQGETLEAHDRRYTTLFMKEKRCRQDCILALR